MVKRIRVVPNEDLASRTIGGEAKIISVRDSRLHQLDEVGTFLWELIQQGQDELDTLVDQVVASFEVDEPQARADIEEFLAELQRLGLVRVVQV